MRQVWLEGCRPRIANSQRRDLHGSGEVAFLEPGRDAQDIGDIVEAERGIVRGQERADVDIKGKQVANGVCILGSIETMKHRAGRRRDEACSPGPVASRSRRRPYCR